MSSDGSLSAAEPLSIEQNIEPRAFVGLSLRNGLLNIVTLSLYRFWGRTEVRRRLWSRISINGDALEYTGRGKELFIGFLIATAVIGAPFLLAAFAAQMAGPALGFLILAPLYVFMIFLVGFGTFAAFRYIASRTTWRGVRSRLDGSGRGYGWAFLGYLLLSGLTFGWFWPAAQRRLAARLWGGLSLGDRPLEYDLNAARKVSIYGPFALGWCVAMGLYVGVIVVIVAVTAGLVAANGGAELSEPPMALTMLLYGLFGMLFAFALPAAFAPYHAAMLRSVSAGVRLGEVRFDLDVPWSKMAWLMIGNLLLLTASLGLLMPYVQARTARLLLGHLKTSGYVELASIRQTDTGPRTGEGLADAFGLQAI